MRPHELLVVALAAIATWGDAVVLAQTNPVVISGSREYWGSANHLDLSGNYLFLSIDRDPAYLHWVYDISDPTNPVAVAGMAPYGESITTSGGYAYVESLSAVYILGISNPTEADTVGSLTSPGKVAVSGNFAYVARGSSGLRIYDVTNPATPVAVGHSTNDFGGSAADVAVSGNYAYVANGADGLRVFDVSNPAAPFNVGPSGLSPGAEIITISGDYAYVGVTRTNFLDWGTTVYDITSRTNPVRGGHIAGICGGTSVSGNFLYIANGPIWVFDVSDFTHPFRVGYYDDGSEWFTDIRVRGDYAYVSAGYNPFYVFWLGAPPPPRLAITRRSGNQALVLSWPAPSGAFSVQQSGGLSTGHWVTLPDIPAVVNSRNEVTVPTPRATTFYRLASTP